MGEGDREKKRGRKKVVFQKKSYFRVVFVSEGIFLKVLLGRFLASVGSLFWMSSGLIVLSSQQQFFCIKPLYAAQK